MTTDLGSLIIVPINSTSAKIVFNNSGSDIATYNDRGNYTVSVTIEDNGTSWPGIPDQKNFTSTFNIHVNSTHIPPNLTYQIINSGNLTQYGNLIILFNASDRQNSTITFFTSDPAYPINETSSYSVGNTSYANAMINITNMSKYYVINHIFSVTAFDGYQNNTESINLTILDVNDPPQIFDNSYYVSNTMNNINISNMVAYTGVPFIYKVNASDPDDLTYDYATKGLKNYTSNDSRFPIDPNSGIISFTPNQAGNYTFLVIVSDYNGSSVNKTANIQININHPPYFLNTPIIIYCNETDPTNWPLNCTYNLSTRVNDNDIPFGDMITNYWTNSTFFVPDTNGMINFFVYQSNVGIYNINFSISDSKRGATNSTIITLIVNNTNNPPNITSIITIPSGNKYIGATYNLMVNAVDLDLLLPNSLENLTFTLNASGPDPSIFSTANKLNSTTARIRIFSNRKQSIRII